VIPLLAFDDADAELWNDDPEEYIRKGYDIIEDIYSPKTSAGTVLCSLCSSDKKKMLDFTMSSLAAILQSYHSESEPHSEQSARRVDGALLAIGSLSHILRVSPYTVVGCMRPF